MAGQQNWAEHGEESQEALTRQVCRKEMLAREQTLDEDGDQEG